MATSRESDDVLRNIVQDVVLTASQLKEKLKFKPVPASITNSVVAPEKPAESVAPTSLQTPPYRTTETLAAFIVRAMAMDPIRGFDITSQLSTADVDRLVKVEPGGRVR